MSFRNERTLYKRKCNAPGHNEDIISVYSSDKPFTVYDDRYWWSDAWDINSYGKDYDFTKPFFKQFRELLERVPLINLSVTNNVNSPYCNVSQNEKDCYLNSASNESERVMYSNRLTNTKDSSDVYISDRNELCHELVDCAQNYHLLFSFGCKHCIDSAFLYDCVNCQNCFCCSNLRNKEFYIFNKPYSKKEYIQKIKEFNLGSFEEVKHATSLYHDMILRSIHKFAHILKSINVTGDNVRNAKNCINCFDIVGSPSAEDCKFLLWGGIGIKDSYDGGPGIGEVELIYDASDTGLGGSNNFFTSVVYGSYDIRYCINCHSSRHLFGCYGLRSKEYCILNKQYTKEEYERLVPKIIEHINSMPYIDKKGRIYKYGEFFPPELSPFAYNETIAQEYFPLSKAEAESKGFSWKDPEERNYQIDIKSEDLPDHIKDVKDDILDKIIGCIHQGKCNEQCTEAFRIIPQELEFYKRMNLPLPRLCPNCRHYQRLKQRNPLKLWHRKCQCTGNQSENGVYKNTISHFHGKEPCLNEFETTYSPERPEIVYCEKCYQTEVV
jgi:hypothetical protein